MRLVPAVLIIAYPYQVLTNLPVSARAFNKRGIGGGRSNIFSRMNSFARMNSGASMVGAGGGGGSGGGGSGGGGGGGNNRHRRFVKGTSFNSGNTTSATTGTCELLHGNRKGWVGT